MSRREFHALRLPALEPQSATALTHSTCFIVLLAVGAAGLLCDSGVVHNMERVADLHLLFAALLAASVAVRFHWGIKQLGSPANPQWNAFARSSSRLIYLLLYALVATQLFIDLAHAAAGHAANLNTEHCRVYVGFGVLAQLLLRTLSYLAK